MEVGCLLAHTGDEPELESEQIGLSYVAVAAAVADHRVAFFGFEAGAALEAVELVRPEVDRPIDDGPGSEGTGDRGQRRRHRVDEGALASGRQHLARMTSAQRLREQELRPEQPDSVDVQAGGLSRPRRQGQVHVQLRGRDGSGDGDPRCGDDRLGLGCPVGTGRDRPCQAIDGH
jgi:hypothetical protein